MFPCDCVRRITEQLKEQGYEDAHIENQAFTFPKLTSVLGIPFGYRKRKKNGEHYQKRFSISVNASHCPFCGVAARKVEEQET